MFLSLSYDVIMRDAPVLLLVQGLFKASHHQLVERKGFLTALQSSQPAIVSEAFPVHGQDETRALGRMLRSSLLPFRGLDINRIRSYFGMCGYFNHGTEVGYFCICLCVKVVWVRCGYD